MIDQTETEKHILISILHDPNGSLLPHLRKVDFLRYYSGIVVNVTPETHQPTVDYLKAFGDVLVSDISDLSTARRQVMRHVFLADNSRYYHYCDLDRLVHWANNYPDELYKTLSGNLYCKFGVLGRTKQAMMSHPFVQRVTEGFVNTMYRFKTGNNFDLLAASRLMSRNVLAFFLNHSSATGPCVDIEWALMCKNIDYIECDGLEYESEALGIKRELKAEIRLRMWNLYRFVWYLWVETDTW